MSCNLFARLMYSILPPSVANELRHHRPVPAKKFECVTILFSGIVGFNQFCAKNSDARGAMKIVKLLNDIYTKFDVLMENPNLYKVSIVSVPRTYGVCDDGLMGCVCQEPRLHLLIWVEIYTSLDRFTRVYFLRPNR